MTREEVIKQLNKLKSFHNGSYGEALNFAIESIKVDLAYDLEYEKTESDRKKEPCDDYISRADAIKALEYSLSIEADGGLDKYRTVIKDLLDAIYDMQKKAIEDLPSIQPKTEVLDKIKAEIKALSPEPTAYDVVDGNPVKDAIWETLIEVDKIIDKYKTESEE